VRLTRPLTRFTLSLAAFSCILNAQMDLGRVVPADRSLHIVAFGDFGSGEPGQIEVARAIQKRNSQKPFTFGITMGDNFYRCGVRSVNDPKWKTRWEDLYTPLGIPFYASLGNHDYARPPIACPAGGASPEAEIARTKLSPSWRMPARYYTYTAGPVRFIAIDTEGWSLKQFEWIRKMLKDTANEPGIKWKVVYGHHPMYTSGVHFNERRIGVLRRDLFPVLKAAGVDLYICGHDHDMERLQQDGIDMLIAGSGGADLRRVRHPEPQSVFAVKSYGFLDIEVTSDHIAARFLDPNLKSLEKNSLLRRRQ
jgi:predicted MPP superfamily phosphohydrolase